MKKGIVFKAVLPVFLFLFFCLPTLASDGIKDTYRIGKNVYATTDHENQIIIISGTGATFDFDEDGYDSSGLYKNPFSRSDGIIYRSVVIEDGVTTLGSRLFKSSRITDVQLPGSLLYIKDYAFYDSTSLPTIELPDNLISIGRSAFECSLWSNYGYNFKLTIPNSVKTIGPNAFAATLVSEFVLPNSLKTISRGAFRNSPKMKSFVVPNSVTTIEAGALSGCGNLQQVHLPSGLQSIGEEAFNGNILLTELNIPGSVTTIGENALAGCKRLFSVTFNNGTKVIEDGAFNGCIRLQSVSLPASITSIGDYAFRSCTMLKSVTLQNGATVLGRSVFTGTKATLTASKGSGVESYAKKYNLPFKSNGTYYMPAKNQQYVVGKLKYQITKSAKTGGTVAVLGAINSSQTSIAIPDTVKINNYTFDVTAINSKAFVNNTKIKNVSIGKNVSTIYSYAFYGCSSLTTVKMGNNVTAMSGAVFKNCTKLSSITLPSKLKSIGNDMFYNCKALKSVSIGSYVTSVGNNSFRGCSSLTTVKFGSNVATIGSAAFRDCTKLNNVTLPVKVKVLSPYLFYNCKSLTKVSVGKYTTTVGDNAFRGCTALGSITLPSRVTTIGNNAFYGDKGLKRITVQSTGLKKVDSNSLKGIYSKATIKVPASKYSTYTKLFKSKGQASTVKVIK